MPSHFLRDIQVPVDFHTRYTFQVHRFKINGPYPDAQRQIARLRFFLQPQRPLAPVREIAPWSDPGVRPRFGRTGGYIATSPRIVRSGYVPSMAKISM